MEIGSFHPALVHAHVGQSVGDAAVCVDGHGVDVWYTALYQPRRHAASFAVLSPVSGIDHKGTGVLHLLEHGYGASLSAHVYDDFFRDFSVHQFRFAVDCHRTAAFAQRRAHAGKYGRIAAYMIR